MSNIIEVKSLVKSFGSVVAVNDISFNVKEGELFAFLGPNGAGKSTTIDILCTLLEKSSGDVEIYGLKLGKDDFKIRREIGIVFQENCMDNLLTVKQNLISRAYLYETDKNKIKRNLDYACSTLHIGDLLNRSFGKLSGGQKRRCEIARALINAPKILFLDEPSTGLDPQTRRNVWECIEYLRREQKITVFLTTHYMEEAANATNIAIIDRGKIAALGTPMELKEKYSTDVLKIASDDLNHIKSKFDDLNIDYSEKNNLFQVKIPNSLKALEILKSMEKYISSFEVIHGTMDDVFLNITGKSLRED